METNRRDELGDLAQEYIGDLIAEVHAAGFDQVLLENVQFPSSTSTKQDYGATNGVDRAGQLTADIAAWQARFGDRQRPAGPRMSCFA